MKHQGLLLAHHSWKGLLLANSVFSSLLHPCCGHEGMAVIRNTRTQRQQQAEGTNNLGDRFEKYESCSIRVSKVQVTVLLQYPTCAEMCSLQAQSRAIHRVPKKGTKKSRAGNPDEIINASMKGK